MNVLKSFKRFRELYEAGTYEFIGFYLPAANLHETNLKGADFRNASLAAANFQGANLCDADFSHANLRGASFEEAFQLIGA